MKVKTVFLFTVWHVVLFLYCHHRRTDQAWRHQVCREWRNANVPQTVWEGTSDYSLLSKKNLPFTFFSYPYLGNTSRDVLHNLSQAEKCELIDTSTNIKLIHLRCACSALGGFPTSQLPPQAQAKRAGALPPRQDGRRAARQDGRWPLHLCWPGGLWLWEPKEAPPSVLLQRWWRLRQHWRRSVPDVLNSSWLEAWTLIYNAKHLFSIFVHFLFYYFSSNHNRLLVKFSFKLNHRTVPQRPPDLS